MRYFTLLLYLSALVLGISSCELFNKTEYEVSNITPYDISISFYEYNSEQEEVCMTTAYIPAHQTQYFTPVEGAVAIKVFMNDFKQWVQRIYYINRGKTTYISITPDIPLGYSMP